MIPLKNGDFDISSFFELTPDLVCIAGKDGYFRKINSAVVDKLEYSEEELMQSPISSYIHPEDREQTGLRRQKLLEGETLINFQNRYLTKSGKIVWLQWTSVYIVDQEVVFAIAKDITEKKQVEQELEARYKEFESLARYFKQTMEKDRRYVALELHEELAQLASMVKLNMTWLDSQFAGLPEGARGRIEQVSNLTERMVDTIRNIAFSFSPCMLEDLGLSETLTVLCRDFQALKRIHCTFGCTLDPTLLTQEAAMDLFRICQEVLSLIEKGSAMAEVRIRLEKENNRACLRIIGIGSDGSGLPDKQLRDLPGVRKRVASMNGQISIAAEEGNDWQMTVCMPLKEIGAAY